MIPQDTPTGQPEVGDPSLRLSLFLDDARLCQVGDLKESAPRDACGSPGLM